jgi:hypothetical protein
MVNTQRGEPWNGQVAMDPRDELLSEEFWLYSAECRRMARLAQKRPGNPANGVQAYSHVMAWLADIQRRLFSPARHHVQFAKNARSDRR